MRSVNDGYWTSLKQHDQTSTKYSHSPLSGQVLAFYTPTSNSRSLRSMKTSINHALSLIGADATTRKAQNRALLGLGSMLGDRHIITTASQQYATCASPQRPSLPSGHHSNVLFPSDNEANALKQPLCTPCCINNVYTQS